LIGGQVAILDYGSGNLRSVTRALQRVAPSGIAVLTTSDRGTVEGSDALVVPGVGAFAACMRGLRSVHGPELIDRFLAGGRPVLGICVGMQILFARGVEHGVETEGCDEWPGVVERLAAPIVPHMGWNTVAVPGGSALFGGIEGERFYFVHSYAVRRWELVTGSHTRAPVVTWSEHGGDRFVSAVENGPLTATQFHPEKSGDAGARLLANWFESWR
jgi:glutamine amidotransferase